METLTPEKTFFSKSVLDGKPFTVADYKIVAKALGVQSWREAARKCAKLRGGALVLRANGDLLVCTLQRGGQGVRQKTYPAAKWGWEGEIKNG